MSHRHFCDFAGHYWECPGKVTRLFAAEATECVCMNHNVPMEDGDHSECCIELLSCPAHRADQMRAMGHDPDYTVEPTPEDPEGSSMFQDKDGNRTIGFCLWCNRDFYSNEEVETHNANDMAECEVFQELRDEHRVPPVLEMMLEESEKQRSDKEP